MKIFRESEYSSVAPHHSGARRTARRCLFQDFAMRLASQVGIPSRSPRTRPTSREWIGPLLTARARASISSHIAKQKRLAG